MNIKFHLQKIVEKVTNKTCDNCIYHSILCDRDDDKGRKCRTGVFPVGFVRKINYDNEQHYLGNHKFIEVTKHFGFFLERCGNENYYVIYRIENGKPTNVVRAMEQRELAIKKCRYLEKLNYPIAE